MITKTDVNHIIDWIRNYFADNGPEANAIVGISGGKDSTVVATLCALALGRDRVIGVLMPQEYQHDIDVSYDVVESLGIRNFTVDIGNACNALYDSLRSGVHTDDLPHGVLSNAPARIRMTTLYAIAAMFHGRVANTCNFSETYVGWETKYGDAAGDFAPIAMYTTEEVIEIGRIIGVPERFLLKTPEDGLSGKTDEEALGFSYKQLNDYITNPYSDNYGNIPADVVNKIKLLHKNSKHKRECLHIPNPGANY